MDTHYYNIAGMTLAVSSDLPIRGETFHPKFKQFAVQRPGEDVVHLHHHFHLLDVSKSEPGKKVYEKPPWKIYAANNRFTYVWMPSNENANGFRRAGVFSLDHTQGVLYNDESNQKVFHDGNAGSLTLFPTDQILLARLLADRKGCILHATGMIMDGDGLLFAGHSDAGKSTLSLMMKQRATILCDDRNIVKKETDGFKLYGTWSHGDVEAVSADSAGLKGILFLQQAQENSLVKIEDRSIIVKKLLACLIKPYATQTWWNRTLDLVKEIVREVPCYALCFDKSGEVVELLEKEFN
jgi:hypothetical protein